MHSYIFCEDSKKAYVGDKVKVYNPVIVVSGTIRSIGWINEKYFGFTLEEENGDFYCCNSKIYLLESCHEDALSENESNRKETIKKIADKYWLGERLLKCSNALADLTIAINDMLRLEQYGKSDVYTYMDCLDQLDEGIANASVMIEQLKYFRYYKNAESDRIEELIDKELERQLKLSTGNLSEKYLI